MGIIILVVCAIGIYSSLRWVFKHVMRLWTKKPGHVHIETKQETARLPGTIELSSHCGYLLAEVERKKQSSMEAISNHKSILERLATEEAKIRSGLEGEFRLDDFLRSQLSEEWTIIAGYRAHKGEIDRILVGPSGVFAFEVKNLGGVIHCDGDRWWYDKTDRYGNIVEQNILIADNGGRSPSCQINDAANALKGMLAKNGHDVVIVRVVVFTHPRARLGNINNLSVNFLAKIPMNVGKILSRGAPLSQEQARQIATTIRQHHEWFERKEQRSVAQSVA